MKRVIADRAFRERAQAIRAEMARLEAPAEAARLLVEVAAGSRA